MSTNQNPPPSPPTFNDNAGRSWTIRLDFAALKRIRTGAQVDLGDLASLAQVWGELLYDDLKALAAVWFAVEPTAAANGTTRDAFEEAMDGVTLDAAREALGVAVINFSPSKRDVAAAAIRHVTDGMRKAMQQAEAKMAAEIQAKTEEALAALGT